MFKNLVSIFSLLPAAAILVSCTTPPPQPVPQPIKLPPPKPPEPVPVIPPVPAPPAYKPPVTSFTDAAEIEDANYPAERIVMARRSVLGVSPIKQRLSKEQINECMDILSDTLMMEYELFMRPFSPFETKLIVKIQKLELPIVVRTRLDLLRSTLRNQALLSLREAKRRGIPVSAPAMPGVEDKLFGISDCVLASAGTPDGNPRYGDVIIRLKQPVKNIGWATPWNGLDFMTGTRPLAQKQNPEGIAAQAGKGQEIKIGFDDLNHLSQYVVIGKDWNRALAYQAILNLRTISASKQSPEIVEKTLLEATPNAFWQTLVSEHAGCSLEAKFPGSVSADYFESIEVNEKDLPIVLAWPEAAPYKSIIRGIPANASADSSGL